MLLQKFPFRITVSVLSLFGVSILVYLYFPAFISVPDGLKATDIPGVYVRDTILDLGTVSPNQVIQLSLDLFNKGTDALSIIRVKSDCACTTVSLPSHNLLPGGKLSLPVQLDASAIGSSLFQKGILITFTSSGDKIGRQLVFVLKGTVDRTQSLTIFPSVLDFGKLVPGTTTSRTIYVKGCRSLLQALPSTVHIQPTGEHTLNVYLSEVDTSLEMKPMLFSLNVPQTFIPKLFQSSYTINIGGTLSFKYVIPLQAQISHIIDIFPKKLLLCTGDLSEDSFSEVHIKSAVSKRVLVEKIMCNIAVEWRIVSVASNRMILRVYPKRGLSLDQPKEGKLMLYFKGVKQAEEIHVILVPTKSSFPKLRPKIH